MLQSELGRGSTFTVRLPLQLSQEPRLEFDLAGESIDLSKAQKVDVRLYAGSAPSTPLTRVDRPQETVLELDKKSLPEGEIPSPIDAATLPAKEEPLPPATNQIGYP